MSGLIGCCSRYVECSDALKCIHPDPEFAAKCAYRANLLKGRLFYGKNAGMHLQKKEPAEAKQADADVYLYCGNRLFLVRTIIKGYSYKIPIETAEDIKEQFQRVGILYKTEADPFLCVTDRCTPEDPEPAGCSVVFLHQGEEFRILNYNKRLIKSRDARAISEELTQKGIKNRIEGTKEPVTRGFVKPVESIRPIKQEPAKQKAKEGGEEFEQVTFFDLLN